MNKRPIILVTGGAGYIGSHTILELLKDPSSDIISIDNHSNSSPDVYARIEHISGHKIRHAAIDLCNKEELEQFFEATPGIQGIIHFAAFKAVGESVSDPLKYYSNNISSLLNILHFSSKYNIRNIIFSSSCSVYGNINQLPVTESTPMQKAESPYAYTKVIGERVLEDFIHSSPAIKAISLRYFNPVGAHLSGEIGELPIQKPTNLVPVITQTAIGRMSSFTVFGADYKTRDGSCIRDYVHVSDIARAHVIALRHLEKSTLPYDVFNLGTGNGVSVLEAIAAFKKVTGITPAHIIGLRRDGDVEAIYSDCKKATEVLGWKAELNLEDMMSSAWKWEQKLSTLNK